MVDETSNPEKDMPSFEEGSKALAEKVAGLEETGK